MQRPGRDGADGEDKDLVTVNPFPAQHVGDPAENDGAESRGKQRGGIEPRYLGGAAMRANKNRCWRSGVP